MLLVDSSVFEMHCCDSSRVLEDKKDGVTVRSAGRVFRKRGDRTQ